MLFLWQEKDEQRTRTKYFYLLGNDRNCDNIVYLLHKSKTSDILTWDRIEPRYFLRAQGQSFHFYTIVLRFHAAFSYNHRIRISVKNVKCFLQVRVDQHGQRRECQYAKK